MKFWNRGLKRISLFTLIIAILSSILITPQVRANSSSPQIQGLSNYVVELSSDPTTATRPSTFGTLSDDGRVWADKSVSVNGNQFDVTLSALGQEYIRTSTNEVKAQAAADVALVLDMSSSMNDARVTSMTKAVNRAIDIIMAANPRNRIGIYYFGGSSNVNTLFELASYSTTGTGDKSNATDRYITNGTSSNTRTITRKAGLTQKFLDGASGTTSQLTISTSSGTSTQKGLDYAIKTLKDDITSRPTLSSADLERVPYVLLLSDGEASRGFPQWYNSPPGGSEISSNSAEVAALTILTAAKLKDELKAAYSVHSGGKDVVWFNVAFGLNEGDNLATAALKPSVLLPTSTGTLGNVYSKLNTLTTSADSAYQKYGVGGTPGYVYANEYIYFVSDTNLGKVDDAIGALASLVEKATQETIIPFEQKDAQNNPLNLIITDVLGSGMELKGAPRMGTLDGTIKSVVGTVTTYGFSTKKTTVEYDSATRQLKWIISPDELPLIKFASRTSPTPGNYSNASLQPEQLKYTVGAEATYDSATLYSNEYINTATTTMSFIPNVDNPYYYKNITVVNNKVESTPKVIGIDTNLELSVQKSTNVTGTASEVYINEWQASNNEFTTKLGNNGKIMTKLKIEMAPASSLVSPGEKITYNITVSNLTTSDISNVVVGSVLANSLTFVTGSLKEEGTTKPSGAFPYSIGTVPANNQIVLSFEASVPTNATPGTEYISETNITAVGGSALSNAATCVASKVTVADVFSPNILLKLDDATYSNQTVELWKDNEKKYTLAESDNKYSAIHIKAGTYYVYVNSVNTGIQISNANSDKEIKYYTVTFYDGTQKLTSPSVQYVLSGGNAQSPTTNPTKNGYTFDSWVQTNGGSTAFEFSTASITNKTSVFAKWTANTNTAYKVNHHQENLAGNSYATPIVENKTGTTGGWTNAVANSYDGFSAKSFSQKIIEADGSTVIDIYYERNEYKITFSIDLIKGVVADNSDTVIKAIFGSTITAPSITANEGYEFKGWNPTITSVTEDAVYTANFDLIEYTITYNLGGGTVTVANPTTYTIESTDMTLNNPTKLGYTFNGWSGTGLTEESVSVKINRGTTGNRSYAAMWTANDYSVTLNDNGGSGGSGSVIATYDKSMPEADKPSRPGYQFIGYYDSISDGKKYYNADMSSASKWDKTNSPVILYALWTELNHVTLEYVSNNTTYGTVSLSSETLNPETGTAKGSNAIPNAGYKFVEWQKANRNSVSTDANFIPVKDSGSYKTSTYTAVFSIENYSITYNLDEGTTAYANKTSYTIEDSEFTLINPTRFGYYFEGWTGTGLTAPTFNVTVPKGSTGNRSYTATWKKVDITDDHIVMGTVIDDGTPPSKISGATVQIVKGNTQYGDTVRTDAAGNFTIYNIPEGIYNLIITLEEQKAIIEITIGGEEQIVKLGNVIFPYKASSELKLLGKDTPAIIIDNLHPEAVDSLENEYRNTGFVKVEMRIEKIDQTTKDSDLLNAIRKIDAQSRNDNLNIGMYLDMNVEKYYRITENISWNSQGLISKTNGLIKVSIPIPKELQGKSGYKVYRYHANEVNLIESKANADGEYLVLDQSNWMLTLYVKNFSVYAVAYLLEAEFQTNFNVTYSDDVTEGNTVLLKQTATFGSLLTPPTDPIKKDFTFIGWVKDNGVLWDFSNERVYYPITLTTKWAPALDKLNHFAYMQGYPDKTFGSQKNMTRAEVTVMFARLLVKKMDIGKTYPSKFKDVDATKWYANAIGYMEQYGIITGYSDGTFKPNVTITRAEFAAIASRFDKLIVGNPVSFTDIDNGYWARDYISFAATKGWIKGYPDNTFKPAKSITRAEVVSLVNRMLERYSDSSYVEKNKVKINQYVDLTNSHWAYDDIMESTNSHDYEKYSNSELWSSHTK